MSKIFLMYIYTLKVTLKVTFKFIKYIKFYKTFILNTLNTFSYKIFNAYIYIKVYIYINVILNVNIYMSINDYSFKYICLASYLKFRFYCLTCSAMSNLTSPDFTITR